MKSFVVLILLNVFIVSHCEVDLPVLMKMAELLEKDGKLTPNIVQPFSVSEINNKVKEATLAFVEHCKKAYLTDGNLYIPVWNISKDIPEAQSFVRANLRDVQIKNLGSLRFHNLTADLFNLTAEYGVYFKQDLQISGRYWVNGALMGQKLSGEGVFDIFIKGMKIAGITVAPVKNKHIQISNLESSFDMDDIKINITNLTIENFTEEELTMLINSAAIIYVKQYQDFISRLGAPVVIEWLNALIADKKVTEMMAFVRRALEK